MLFLLIRILPFALPVVYFFTVQAGIRFYHVWFYFGAEIAIFNLIYFGLLYLRLKQKNILLFFFYSIILSGVAFFYSLLIDRIIFLNLFLIVWSILYLLYLEAVFNHVYKTEKIFLTDLKNVTSYLNIIIFFFFTSGLLNLYIYLNLGWWWTVLAFTLVTPFLLSTVLMTSNFAKPMLGLYSAVISLILWQLFLVILFLPLSFLVSAIIICTAYYLLISFALIAEKKISLSYKTVVKYLIFSLIIISAVLTTAKWF